MKKLNPGYFARKIRAILLAAAANESLFFFAAFISYAILGSELFTWHQEATQMFERFIVVPWGMALCLLRLDRKSRQMDAPWRLDLSVLFVLVMWVIVPFGIRFGLTFNNVTSWQSHCAAYFALYAMLSEEKASIREQRFDLACALMGVFSLVVGGALMYCAATGAQIDSNWIVHYGTYAEGGYGFGVYNRAQLCTGLHYNITGMMALSCTMFCFAGVCRGKNRAVRALYMLAAAMMVIVVVLTQSRTARYSLIGAIGAGVYGYAASRRRISRAWLRHAVGLALAGVVMVLAYGGASMLTDAALEHYARVDQRGGTAMIAAARAQEETQSVRAPQEARQAVDGTMSGRTDVWKNVLKYWKENPKEMLIGAGAGKIGSRIVKGTIHERGGSVAVHNAYLQYAADYGLIGFGLMMLFFGVILVPVLRAFFAPEETQIPGYRAMGMLVVASLMTGMMESATLGAMSPINASMLFALALLFSAGTDMKKNG